MKRKSISVFFGMVLIGYLMYLFLMPINNHLISNNDQVLIKINIGVLILMANLNMVSLLIERKTYKIDLVNKVLIVLILSTGIYFSLYKIIDILTSSLCETRKTFFTLGFSALVIIFIIMIGRITYLLIKSKKRT